MLIMNKNSSGFAHLVVLFVVIFVAIAVLAFVYVKPGGSPKKDSGVSQEISPTVAVPSSGDLEKDLEAIEVTDPSSDFSEVDSDIKSL